jgi:hypothetical protein
VIVVSNITLRFVHFLNRPIWPLIIVAVLYFLFLTSYLRTRDAAFFVQAGDHFVDTTQAPANLYTVSPYTGYDGTFYYRLALTPFTQEQTAFGITLDNPRYRHQRILYPLLAWFFSFGSPPLAIYSLILVNFLGLCALGWVGGYYAQTVERHALWGVLFALYPGFLYTLSRNLTEIVEALFVLAALVALRQQRTALAVCLLVLAILSKETAVLIPAAILILTTVTLWQKKALNKWWVGLIPLLAYGLWQLWLTFWWNDTLTEAARANLGLPFIGVVQGFYAAATIGGSQTRWLIEVVALLLLAVAVCYFLHHSQASRLERLGWGLYLSLLLLLSAQVWIEGIAFLRAASLFYLFSVIILLNARNKIANALLIASLGFWGIMAIDLLYFW